VNIDKLIKDNRNPTALSANSILISIVFASSWQQKTHMTISIHNIRQQKQSQQNSGSRLRTSIFLKSAMGWKEFKILWVLRCKKC
jgi:hypothetical protein